MFTCRNCICRVDHEGQKCESCERRHRSARVGLIGLALFIAAILTLIQASKLPAVPVGAFEQFQLGLPAVFLTAAAYFLLRAAFLALRAKPHACS